MQPDPEARVRAALEELGGALIALARDSQAKAERSAEPIELLDVQTFARRASLGRSTVWLAISSGSIRSIKVRGRRLVPSSELVRLTRTEDGRPA